MTLERNLHGRKGFATAFWILARLPLCLLQVLSDRLVPGGILMASVLKIAHACPQASRGMVTG